MRPIIVLFTRDLRVRDHPALAAAADRGAPVVPLFVVDPAITSRAARNRIAYLCEALAGLRGALRAVGGGLVLRCGDTVREALCLAHETGAGRIHLSADVSALAAARSARLRREAAAVGVEVAEFPGVTVVAPGELVPAGGDHYKVFTPFWRAWEAHRWRDVVAAPRLLSLPTGVSEGGTPEDALKGAGVGELSPSRQPGGEQEARRRLSAWLSNGCSSYERLHDDLAAAATSRLSADLRFGCLSPVETARAALEHPGGRSWVRQLAWRDFHHQVTAAFPGIAVRDYRPRDVRWRDDEDALEAWRGGRTGVPIVDAGMRQLVAEGFMHNRARMIAAAFLTRHLRLHWRHGAAHFHALLTDGDVADNCGNWQWVAGTGNDTRPNRRFNLLRQSRRFDRDGDYIRRHVAELAGLSGPDIHAPWRARTPPVDYPIPLTDLGE
ncbi:deoxyribodipyrimidine photo-lyase [Nocardiopsis gilva YIM 90087]|uniref:Deoxyribodipyrimidine photo-lyase n=1 Tax=Nocardiopsis gilva YIM 90087 TaxID=1235441 RepID=A0A223S179_9ACTN|nr:deoxyribodipyrimidine photo-lyase [Nocardiopsis gilva]ASU81779.1 deoxyribodipyrimidine photo-lyase [Nocardiopsis gilva YIM 90087]